MFRFGFQPQVKRSQPTLPYVIGRLPVADKVKSYHSNVLLDPVPWEAAYLRKQIRLFLQMQLCLKSFGKFSQILHWFRKRNTFITKIVSDIDLKSAMISEILVNGIKTRICSSMGCTSLFSLAFFFSNLLVVLYTVGSQST